MQIIDEKHTVGIRAGRILARSKTALKSTPDRWTSWDPDRGVDLEHFTEEIVINNGRTICVPSYIGRVLDTFLGAALELGFKFVGIRNTYSCNITDWRPVMSDLPEPFWTEMTFMRQPDEVREPFIYLRPLDDIDADLLLRLTEELSQLNRTKWGLLTKALANLSVNNPGVPQLVQKLGTHDWKRVDYRSIYYYSTGKQYHVVQDLYDENHLPRGLEDPFAQTLSSSTERRQEDLVLFNEYGDKIAYGIDAVLKA